VYGSVHVVVEQSAEKNVPVLHLQKIAKAQHLAVSSRETKAEHGLTNLHLEVGVVMPE